MRSNTRLTLSVSSTAAFLIAIASSSSSSTASFVHSRVFDTTSRRSITRFSPSKSSSKLGTLDVKEGSPYSFVGVWVAIVSLLSTDVTSELFLSFLEHPISAEQIKHNARKMQRLFL